jgi:hypothetical protein
MAARYGSVERATRADVRKLGLAGPAASTLAHTAYALARKLDQDAGMAAAAVARELRATMADLAKSATPVDRDGLDDLRARREKRRGA